MNYFPKAVYIGCCLALLLANPLNAQEMDHSHMQHESMTETPKIPTDHDHQNMGHEMHGTQQDDQKQKNAEQHSDHAQHDMNQMSQQPQTHQQHQAHQQQDSQQHAAHIVAPTAESRLERLEKLPASGKSREANFDDTPFMHNTALEQPLEAKCALASRGLMMLDNDSWQKCGGKPASWSKGVAVVKTSKDKEHQQHLSH